MLLLHPEESLHGREIARRTGLPAGTLTRELKRLADVGLLNRQRRGNQLIYSANRDSPIFEELAGILRKTSGLSDVVAEALEPLTDRVDVAFIFGSVARAAETPGSDVDVLIIGSIDFGTVVDALHTAQPRLARDICRGTSAADERLGDNALIEKAATSQPAAITCPSSRFFGRLPKTEIDLNSSMCALSCRQSCESQTITGILAQPES